MHIELSVEVHANQADEVFMGVGDKSKKLTFEERTQLMYDKGERFYEDKPVPDADIEDIDMEFVKADIQKNGYSKSPLEYLKENKGFIKKKGISKPVQLKFYYLVRIRNCIFQERECVLSDMK